MFKRYQTIQGQAIRLAESNNFLVPTRNLQLKQQKYKHTYKTILNFYKCVQEGKDVEIISREFSLVQLYCWTDRARSNTEIKQHYN